METPVDFILVGGNISNGESSAVEHHHHHHHHYHVYDAAEPSTQRRLITAGNSDIGSNNHSRSSTTEIRNLASSDSSVSQHQVRKSKTPPLVQAYASIKTLSLSHLTAKQHLLMAVCRDVSLLPPITYTFTSLQRAWRISFQNSIKLYEPQSLKDTINVFLQNYMKHNVTSVNKELISETTLGSSDLLLNTLTTARASEYLLCSLWCIVSLYLTYAILDSLMVRWIVKYSTLAAILRMFSMSLIIITLELLLLGSLSPKGDYHLHTWILLSCVLTSAYIWQSYLTSNLNYVSHDDYEDDVDDEDENFSKPLDPSSVGNSSYPISSRSSSQRLSSSTARSSKSKRRIRKSFKFTKKRTIDFYNITVFCVVPLGVASFITMIGLLRNLVIQRLDVEQLSRVLQTTTYFSE